MFKPTYSTATQKRWVWWSDHYHCHYKILTFPVSFWSLLPQWTSSSHANPLLISCLPFLIPLNSPWKLLGCHHGLKMEQLVGLDSHLSLGGDIWDPNLPDKILGRTRCLDEILEPPSGPSTTFTNPLWSRNERRRVFPGKISKMIPVAIWRPWGPRIDSHPRVCSGPHFPTLIAGVSICALFIQGSL